ncbi:MAG: GNAT family N-acetyltransferase [Anaerolineae bacterium]|nr:GNAT family N-acetyltransferase [Anaerolineae bacterium]
MTCFVVRNLAALPEADLKLLLQESRMQGFEFVNRLAAEYANGTNRLDGPGEVLFGVTCGGSLVAIGGLNRDPYAQHDYTGRVRRVYVLDQWRGQGRRSVACGADHC